jgi:hypothetical protein
MVGWLIDNESERKLQQSNNLIEVLSWYLFGRADKNHGTV